MVWNYSYASASAHYLRAYPGCSHPRWQDQIPHASWIPHAFARSFPEVPSPSLYLFLALSPGSIWFSCSWKAISFPLSPTWCSPSWEHEPHCVGMDAVTQGIGEDPSRAKPHAQCSRPSCFYLANTALSTSSEETLSICFMVTCAAGLSYLLHFCFTLGVSLTSRKNVCGGMCRLCGHPTKAWAFCTRGEDAIKSLQLWMWMLDESWENTANGSSHP